MDTGGFLEAKRKLTSDRRFDGSFFGYSSNACYVQTAADQHV